jgi:hypothetical protein
MKDRPACFLIEHRASRMEFGPLTKMRDVFKFSSYSSRRILQTPFGRLQKSRCGNCWSSMGGNTLRAEWRLDRRSETISSERSQRSDGRTILHRAEPTFVLALRMSLDFPSDTEEELPPSLKVGAKVKVTDRRAWLDSSRFRLNRLVMSAEFFMPPVLSTLGVAIASELKLPAKTGSHLPCKPCFTPVEFVRSRGGMQDSVFAPRDPFYTLYSTPSPLYLRANP